MRNYSLFSAFSSDLANHVETLGIKVFPTILEIIFVCTNNAFFITLPTSAHSTITSTISLISHMYEELQEM